MHDPVAHLRELLRAAKYAVCFTGAGISTESGIPDFRSPGGLWSRMQPIDYQDFVTSEPMRREAWRRKLISDRTLRAAEPNRGHRAVAQLVRSGICACVLTQNIDGLHQRSGVPEDKLVELHGNGTYAACLDCGLRHELDPILSAFEQAGTLPVCVSCGGIVKTATISFGQRMPLQAMQRAEDEALASDLFLVLGSSLAVLPAAELPRMAKLRGAKLVIVNREATAQDAHADLVIHAEIGSTLGAAADIE
ncbi:MAG TPA: Sir2 family NAD-dependent protein deacetylase [Burkholderiales bacterium]|nr:Sir2 family NAD-dependent protein deacetylase [Burkholderiales bacterium]